MMTAAVAVAPLCLPGSIGTAVADHHEKDIVDTAVAAGSFNTLAAAIKAGGLVETPVLQYFSCSSS